MRQFGLWENFKITATNLPYFDVEKNQTLWYERCSFIKNNIGMLHFPVYTFQKDIPIVREKLIKKCTLFEVL